MMAAKYLGLFYFSVLVAILAAVTADSTGRRKIPTRDGGHLSQIMMEEYLEDQNREVAEEPKVENASPLQLCILLMSTPFIEYNTPVQLCCNLWPSAKPPHVSS